MKNSIKYLVSFITLLAVVICIGNMVMAEDNEIITNKMLEEEIEIIKAEEIGIKEIEKQTIKESATAETVVENKTIDENLSYKEEVPVVAEENSNEVPAYDEKNEIAEETEANEKYEGYEEGVYFEPNCFGDCPLHDSCYICSECTFVEELFCDEEINPEGENWVLSKTCIVCGHGGCEPVTDEFANNYYGN